MSELEELKTIYSKLSDPAGFDKWLVSPIPILEMKTPKEYIELGMLQNLISALSSVYRSESSVKKSMVVNNRREDRGGVDEGAA